MRRIILFISIALTPLNALHAQFFETDSPRVAEIQEMYLKGNYLEAIELGEKVFSSDDKEEYEERCLALIIGMSYEAIGEYNDAIILYEIGNVDIYLKNELNHYLYDLNGERFAILSYKHYIENIEIPFLATNYPKSQKLQKEFSRRFKSIRYHYPFESELCYYSGMWYLAKGKRKKALKRFCRGTATTYPSKFNQMCKHEYDNLLNQ